MGGKMCGAPGHKLGSAFQVLQNSLKSGEFFSLCVSMKNCSLLSLFPHEIISLSELFSSVT